MMVCIVSTKIHNKRDDFDFDLDLDFDLDIENTPFLDHGDAPRRPSYGIYICLNLFALLEYLLMSVTSVFVTNF